MSRSTYRHNITKSTYDVTKSISNELKGEKTPGIGLEADLLLQEEDNPSIELGRSISSSSNTPLVLLEEFQKELKVKSKLDKFIDQTSTVISNRVGLLAQRLQATVSEDDMFDKENKKKDLFSIYDDNKKLLNNNSSISNNFMNSETSYSTNLSKNLISSDTIIIDPNLLVFRTKQPTELSKKIDQKIEETFGSSNFRDKNKKNFNVNLNNNNFNSNISNATNSNNNSNGLSGAMIGDSGNNSKKNASSSIKNNSTNELKPANRISIEKILLNLMENFVTRSVMDPEYYFVLPSEFTIDFINSSNSNPSSSSNIFDPTSIVFPLKIKWTNNENDLGEFDPELLLRYSMERMNLPSGRRLFLSLINLKIIQKYFVFLFFLIKIKFFEGDNTILEQSFILLLLSKEYKLLLELLNNNCKEEHEKDFVFKYLPYILTNAIFFAFYYLFPGSRHIYTKGFKKTLYMQIIAIMHGFQVCPIAVKVSWGKIFPEDNNDELTSASSSSDTNIGNSEELNDGNNNTHANTDIFPVQIAIRKHPLLQIIKEEMKKEKEKELNGSITLNKKRSTFVHEDDIDIPNEDTIETVSPNSTNSPSKEEEEDNSSLKTFLMLNSASQKLLLRTYLTLPEDASLLNNKQKNIILKKKKLNKIIPKRQIHIEKLNAKEISPSMLIFINSLQDKEKNEEENEKLEKSNSMNNILNTKKRAPSSLIASNSMTNLSPLPLPTNKPPSILQQLSIISTPSSPTSPNYHDPLNNSINDSYSINSSRIKKNNSTISSSSSTPSSPPSPTPRNSSSNPFPKAVTVIPSQTIRRTLPVPNCPVGASDTHHRFSSLINTNPSEISNEYFASKEKYINDLVNINKRKKKVLKDLDNNLNSILSKGRNSISRFTLDLIKRQRTNRNNNNDPSSSSQSSTLPSSALPSDIIESNDLEEVDIETLRARAFNFDDVAAKAFINNLEESLKK